MSVVEIIFWFFLFLIFWTYCGYLLLLKLVSLFFTKKVEQADVYPEVSLIVTAYNEEKRIKEKLENTLALSYPKGKLEIIVVSDGSTDRTEEIVRSYEDKGVQLLAIPERRGKHYGQGQGIKKAKGDIVVLTDATTFMPSDSVEKIVRNFADPNIGCVSSVDRMKSAASGASGEGMYVKYEMKLRDLESAVGSLVGVSGCFFSVRRYLCWEWIDNMSADFYMPIVTRLYGLRTVADPEAISYYEVVQDPAKEFQRKVRTIVHGLEVLFSFRAALNPFKYGFFSLQLLSHKLCRWLVPFCLIILLALNVSLFNQGVVYRLFLAGQIVFYLLAALAHLIRKLQDIALFKIPFFFVIVNLSILEAWYRYLTHQEYVTWDASKR